MSYLDELLGIEWAEDRRIPLPASSYRSRTVICCSTAGRQEARFANGPGKYFAYVELLSQGEWIRQGVQIVPILPDGRFLMVVEQRPAQYVFEQKPPAQIELAAGNVDLASFGPYSSLEFPGGAVHPEDKTVTIGALRELYQETGIPDQSVSGFRQCHPVYPQGADLALELYLSIMYLSSNAFASFVKNDGGLTIFALTFDEVEHNRRSGVIAAAASLLAWAFYKEVEEIKNAGRRAELQASGYIAPQKLTIRRS